MGGRRWERKKGRRRRGEGEGWMGVRAGAGAGVTDPSEGKVAMLSKCLYGHIL